MGETTDYSKKNVGIMGYWFATNYGGVASYYSLYQTLKMFGYSPFLIENPYYDTDKEGDDVFSRNFFREINADISEPYTMEELNQLNHLTDSFILGSDQVLTTSSLKSFGKLFLMEFAEDFKKKIAIASSCGGDKLNADENIVSYGKGLLQRFNKISVREYSSIDLVKHKFGVHADFMLDPIFFTTAQQFREVSQGESIENTPYLLSYILDPTEDKRNGILKLSSMLKMENKIALDGRKFTHEKNLDILDLKEDTLPEINLQQWLYYFENASYVFTDSFHGAAMALILNKPFIIYANRIRGYERFLSLDELFEIGNRLIDKTEQINEKVLGGNIDFERINKIILDEKERALQWIEDALDNSNAGRTAKIPEKAITSLLEKTDCMGCGACTCVCPFGALSLQADEWGYYRSDIDYDKCINCGKCSSVCSALNLTEKNNFATPECFAVVAADEELLYNSSSGGIFSLLAEKAFQKSGRVVGAAWRNDFSVEHIIIDDKKELYKLQKSKYLQSYLGKTFYEVKELLDNDVFVLFSGCPCQVAGLKKYLREDYENLILVDLLCGNSPSAMFFQKYLAEAFPEGVTEYSFRHKVHGWDTGCVTVSVTTTETGTIVRRGGSEDAYQRVYHNHTMCPPHCEKCKYQSVPRYGDLTIGDFWGISQKDPQIDEKDGVSVVLCNNEKGRVFFDSIADDEIKVKREVPLQWLGGNGYAINGSHNYCSPQRNSFYKAIRSMDFQKAANYALKPNHGEYSVAFKESNTPLQFASNFTRFQFDSSIWEEHTINDKTYLMVKPNMSKVGRFAVMPLCQLLDENQEYSFAIRFRIKTAAKEINFHIKDSGTNLYQVIYSYKIKENYNSDEWIEIESKFKPKSNIYDEFMIGAAQVSGADNYICFDYINIRCGNS